MESEFDQQEQRIFAILGMKEEDGFFVSEENSRTYQSYLKINLEFPCLLKGMEDFHWEEKYVFGYGDKREYEELRKTQPSYKDTFKLIEFEELSSGEERLFVEVERVADK